MLTLEVARLPRVDRREAQEVWRDGQGAVCAYGGFDHDGFWLRVPGVGVFVVPSTGDVVFGDAEARRSQDQLEEAFRRTVLPLALQVRGTEVLHASAVYDHLGVVGLCGTSGTGKSTVAANLTRLGYDAFADDALAFDVPHDDEVVEAVSVPFVLDVDDPASPRPPHAPLPPRAPVRTICVLERRLGPITVHGLDAPAAFLEVLRHAYSFTLSDTGRTEVMVNAYLDLVSRVPVLHVRFAPDPARTWELAKVIRDAVDAQC